MVTRVVNMKREPYDIDCTRSGKIGLGNPHPIGWCSTCRKSHNRREAIEAFKREFDVAMNCLKYNEWRKTVLSVKDKVLGCVCKPQACHVDIIAEYLNRTGRYAPEVHKVEHIDLCGLHPRLEDFHEPLFISDKKEP